MKNSSLPISSLFSLLLLGNVTLHGQTTLINDSFADNNIRATGGDTLQADWWSSNSTSNNSVEATGGRLGLVTGSSGRGLHGTFGGRYVTLGTGQSLTARVNFQTPASVGSNESGSLKIALWSFSTDMANHQLSSSTTPNANYNSLEGFMADFDGNLPGTDEDINIRVYNQPATTGRGLGTTTGWTGGSGPDAGYSILANTAYSISLTVMNTASGTDVTATLLQGSTQLDSYTRSFSENIGNIGTLGLWANSDFAGSENSFGTADNGIDITNVTITTDGTIVPEPGTYALIAGMLTLAFITIRRRSTKAFIS